MSDDTTKHYCSHPPGYLPVGIEYAGPAISKVICARESLNVESRNILIYAF
jgi:hypothetical protein